MKFRLEIDCNGDAFANAHGDFNRSTVSIELCMLLKRAADDLLFDLPSRLSIRDTNGNTCGHFELLDG